MPRSALVLPSDLPRRPPRAASPAMEAPGGPGSTARAALGHAPTPRSLSGTYAGRRGAPSSSSISSCSTTRAGDARGAIDGNPTESRILRTVSGSVMNEISRSRPAGQLGQARASIPKTRARSCAQVLRRRISAGESSAACASCGPAWAHVSSGTRVSGTICGRSRACGASTP